MAKILGPRMSASYPYPHDHSRHAIFIILGACIFFISTDNLENLLYKLDTNIKWWSIYACLFIFFYFFSSPFWGKTIKPSYTSFSRWYIAWLFIAAVQHLPSFQSMGMDIRMNLPLFFTLFLSSMLVIILFHLIFVSFLYLTLTPIQRGSLPEWYAICQNCMVISVACCVFYSHCGNRSAPKLKESVDQWLTMDIFKNLWQLNSSTFQTTWPHVHEVKERVCLHWLGPVGSARDYPLFSKWVLYGEKVRIDNNVGRSDNISPVYSLWATLIGLHLANSFVEYSSGWELTHPLFVHEDDEVLISCTRPNFLDMVPWYSGTSADLLKTTFDLVVSVTLFLGRFDMRTMQANVTQAQQYAREDLFLHTHFSGRNELWFDFMADTGDGGNSTYTVARLLAQPSIKLMNKERQSITLPRAQLVLLGGDLAYPNPSPYSYEQRLIRPFEYAMQAPPWFKKEHIAVKKPELPTAIQLIEEYDGPQIFAIPGNHDWFDGLDTFMRYICHKSWLGGWLLPQEKSYFALELPHGWWVFGLDQALQADIDIIQFKYFSEIVRNKVKRNDSVIFMTHEPNWLLDWYWNSATGINVAHLIQDHLQGRCRLRLAGDLHHFMRHSAIPSEQPAHIENLIVNGSGGAFLHPTHVFQDFQHFNGANYKRESAYPSIKESRRIALGNIMKFRKKNWRFDVFGGIIYFLLVFSMLPQCKLEFILDSGIVSVHFDQFMSKMYQVFINTMENSYISMGGAIGLLLFAVFFVPRKASMIKRICIGCVHASAHLSAAITLMLLLELGIETCVEHKLLGTGGLYHLYEWYQLKENVRFPDPYGLRARIEHWTYGLYPACIKYLMTIFDVPEMMAVARIEICEKGYSSVSRSMILVYYVSIFLYYWVFSTPVVSFIFGSYLYISINWFHLHFDEAFSSLRIANYKSFCRCHITTNGDLEIWTLAIDKVPKEWILDPFWETEQKQSPDLPEHMKTFPSQWVPRGLYRERNCNVRIIDYFVIKSLE